MINKNKVAFLSILPASSLTPSVIVTLLSLLIFITGFLSCTNPTTNEWVNHESDSSLTIDGIDFSHDTIYNKAILQTGSNWRLQQFINKCKIKKTINIGFIGGSITAGASASNDSFRYSTLFCTSVRNFFPNLNKVTEINAGIGSTGSRFGCSRIVTDLLLFNPDMIIIEFAVNDFGAGDPMYIRSTMEGIVRQCLSFKKDVPVILLFMAKGNGTNAQYLHEDIGRWYSLPMISYLDAIWPIIKLEPDRYWNTFFHDDPHPNNNGHKVCAFFLSSYLKKELAELLDPELTIPEPLFSDLYETAGILNTNDTTISMQQSGWESILKNENQIVIQSNADSNFSQLRFQTNLREITLGIHMQSNDTSCIRVVVDNGKLDTVINNYHSFEYTRFIRLYTSEDVINHVVQISHFTKNIFSIDYILYAGIPLK